MDEANIESWFDEQREEIFEQLLLDYNDKKISKEDAEKKFKDNMKKARLKYEKLYQKSFQQTVFDKSILRLKTIYNKIIEIYHDEK